MIESFFGTLEIELLDRVSLKNFTHARRRSSSTWRGGTTRTGGTLPSAICRPSTTRSSTNSLHEKPSARVSTKSGEAQISRRAWW